MKFSTQGIEDAAYKHVDTKEIAYNVLISTLNQRVVIVVTA